MCVDQWRSRSRTVGRSSLITTLPEICFTKQATGKIKYCHKTLVRCARDASISKYGNPHFPSNSPLRTYILVERAVSSAECFATVFCDLIWLARKKLDCIDLVRHLNSGVMDHQYCQFVAFQVRLAFLITLRYDTHRISRRKSRCPQNPAWISNTTRT